MFKLPVLVFAIVFLIIIAFTQLLPYQQYKIMKEKQKIELTHEATAVKDRFRNILFSDVAAANTLAIIYKQYGVPARFDSIAGQILSNSPYAQVLQITENGIVKNVYPDVLYKGTIGTNVNTDAARKAEEGRAADRKDIYFAGPRRLRFGDTGILGKVPIILNNKVKAVATVLTRMTVIRKELGAAGLDKKKFAYQLLKIRKKDTSSFPLSDTRPSVKSEYVDIEIPEGDWLLRTSYSDGYVTDKFPFELSGMGILLSFAAGLLAYRKVRQPYKLKEIIEQKTNELAKSEKYFRTLIETSSDAIVLMDIAGKVLYQTPSTEKTLGYTLAEIQEIDGLELIHPDDRATANTMFVELVSTPGNISYQKHRIRHKNGNYVQIEGAYRNLLYDENVKAIVYSYKDVTDKRLSEQQLARYNRELNLLNKINDIILRVNDEFQLYEEVCDSIITIGNYSLSWLCHKPDAGAADQTVVPLAAMGATGFLSGVRIVLNDPDLSNGPTAIVLNTMKTVVNNNAASSTYFGQWLSNASVFGIRASISLPLNLGHDKAGVLSIYARQADAFDDLEVLTLTRLAANLSIAVQNIQNRNELAESENRFRGAFEDSAIGMGLTSIQKNSAGRWLKVNWSLCEMLGYTEDELLLLTFMQITHPEDLTRDLAAQDKILRGETDTYRLEKRYIHKDGSIVWINLNVSLIKDKDKHPLYLVAQVENITERVESQRKFQNLVENFTVGVYIIQNNKIVYVNPCIVEEFGYTEEEIINQPLINFIYKDDVGLVEENIKRRVSGDIKSARYEARIVKKDGTPLWYELLGGTILYRGAPAQIGTMVNITERKAVYDELERSEANMKSIFDTTDVSYLLLDTKYNIIALNQQMKDVYIYAAGLMLKVGDNLIELLLPEKREGTLAIYNRVAQTNKAEDYESSYLKNGAYKHFLANVKPIHDGKKAIGLGISSIDITERKNAIEQLQQLNQNLEKQANELAISNAGLEESEKRYSELFNFSPLPAWVVDTNTLDFLDINNAAVLHYGYTREEFLLMNLKDIRPAEEITNLHRSVVETSANDGVSLASMVHKKKNGELFNVEVQIARIHYSGVEAYIAIATDVTQRLNYIKAIEAQNERLLEISWIQSHIVRAPLSRIMGLVPMLDDANDTADERKTMRDYILTSAHELDEIIKTITDKSKIEDFQSLKPGKGNDA
jgi:PAS domain S-box-containing protein